MKRNWIKNNKIIYQEKGILIALGILSFRWKPKKKSNNQKQQPSTARLYYKSVTCLFLGLIQCLEIFRQL